jgi:hypothetical protein
MHSFASLKQLENLVPYRVAVCAGALNLGLGWVHKGTLKKTLIKVKRKFKQGYPGTEPLRNLNNTARVTQDFPHL